MIAWLGMRFRTALVWLGDRAMDGVLHLIVLASGANRRHPAPDWSRPSKVLLVRYDRIGDMITSTSLIRAITDAHPNVTVDVLASPRNAAIIRRQVNCGEVIIYEHRKPGAFGAAVREIRRRKYDAILDGFVLSNGVSSRRALFMLYSGATYRIGLAGVAHAPIYNLRVLTGVKEISSMHHVDLMALLATPFGVNISATDWRPLITLTAEERAFAVQNWPVRSDSSQVRLLVNISAANDKTRHWPTDRFVAAIRHFRSVSPNSCVLVLALPEDSNEASLIARETDAEPITAGLFESFALIESADLFLSPDTALVHAASAFQTPTICLMKLGNDVCSPHAWTPYGTSSRSVIATRSPGSVDTIELSRVTVAIDEMLTELGARSSVTPEANASDVRREREGEDAEQSVRRARSY